MSGSWDVGERIAGAAALAVERVNTDKSLFPGFQLEKISVDQACTVRISYFTTPGPSKLAMAHGIVDAVTGCKVEWLQIASGMAGVQMITNGRKSPFMGLKQWQLNRHSPPWAPTRERWTTSRSFCAQGQQTHPKSAHILLLLCVCVCVGGGGGGWAQRQRHT